MSDIMQTAKQNLFRLVNKLLKHDVGDTIVVAGTPRSGTTWLAEVLRELPGYKQLNEPLNLNNCPEARECGFEWRTCIEPGQIRPEARSYLEKVLQGKTHELHLWRFQSRSAHGKLMEHIGRGKVVVKVIRASRMLHWFANQFSPRRIVFLIRHPCAVVSSKLKYGSWDPDESDNRSFRQKVLNSWIPNAVVEKFDAALDRIDTHTQKLAATWCLDHYFPFHEHSAGGYPWVLVSYEKLVTNGIAELERVLASIGESPSDRMLERLGVASHTASDSLATANARKQLSKWKRELTTKQIDDILRLVDDFGLDFYTNDLQPDYERLMQFQREDAKPHVHA